MNLEQVDAPDYKIDETIRNKEAEDMMKNFQKIEHMRIKEYTQLNEDIANDKIKVE